MAAGVPPQLQDSPGRGWVTAAWPAPGDIPLLHSGCHLYRLLAAAQ